MNSPSHSLSLLLISPQTYNYHEIIIGACQELGVNCTWLDERPFSNSFFKLFARLSNRLARRLSAVIYLNRLKSLHSRGLSPTHVLIIKGEALHSSVIEYMRCAFPRARFILYFWDSVAKLPGHKSIIPYFDIVASFDYRDCTSYGWVYCPLFSGNAGADHLVRSSTSFERLPLYDWSFVGVVHSDRIQVLDKLLRHTAGSLSHYLYLYFPSYMHLCLYFLRCPAAFCRIFSYIHLAPLPPVEMSRIYWDSRCVLDIHHPCQAGLTMRTIESIVSGVKLASTNKWISREPIYDPSRVLILDRSSPNISPSFLAATSLHIPDSVAEYYHPRQWMHRLLHL